MISKSHSEDLRTTAIGGGTQWELVHSICLVS